MVTLEQALALLEGELDRQTLETYVAHAWVRPMATGAVLQFEEIDIARIRLVRYLQRDIMMGDDGMDVVLHLLDQLYELRRRLAESGGHETASLAEFWERQEEF